MGVGDITREGDEGYSALYSSWVSQGRPRDFWYNGYQTGTPYRVFTESGQPFFVEASPIEQDPRDPTGHWGVFKYIGPVQEEAT